MNYIFGLGNPGKEYEGTRHNVGFAVIDELVKSFGKPVPSAKHAKQFFAEIYSLSQIFLVKPQTFMNDSGKAVRALIEYYDKSATFTKESSFPQVFVVHDDLDIPLGSYKIQFGKGPRVHNGLNSIYDHLHTDQFWHVRVGVDGRAGERTLPGHVYVLALFRPEEKLVVEKVTAEIVTELKKKIANENER